MTAEGGLAFVLDRFVVPADQLNAVREIVAHEYMPLAAKHGWQLEHHLLTPPVELVDGVNEVLILWSTADVGAYWSAYGYATMDDAAVRAVWARLDALLESRTRQCLTTWPVP